MNLWCCTPSVTSPYFRLLFKTPTDTGTKELLNWFGLHRWALYRRPAGNSSYCEYRIWIVQDSLNLSQYALVEQRQLLSLHFGPNAVTLILMYRKVPKPDSCSIPDLCSLKQPDKTKTLFFVKLQTAAVYTENSLFEGVWNILSPCGPS